MPKDIVCLLHPSEASTRALQVAVDLARRHNAHLTGVYLVPPDPTPILAAAGGFDLVVAGAYGHSRLRELVFGGTTRELLNDAPVPVLLSNQDSAPCKHSWPARRLGA